MAAARGGPRRISEKNEKPKDTKYVLKGLWHYVSHYRVHLIIAILLALGSNIFALIGPMLSGQAIDAIEPGEGMVIFTTVFYYAKWMVLFYIVSSALSYILSILMIRLSRRL